MVSDADKGGEPFSGTHQNWDLCGGLGDQRRDDVGEEDAQRVG